MGSEETKYKLVFFITMIVILCVVNPCTAQGKAPETDYLAKHSEITGDTKNENITSLDSAMKLQEGTELVFAGVKDAKEVLTTRDTFINLLSTFDRSARLKTDKYVSEKQFLEYVANQIRPWTDDEKRMIKTAVESVANKLSSFKLNFPQKILLIKTTGKEEGHATYCRGGAIILPQSQLDKQNPNLGNVIIHELFHILTSNDPKLKESLYEVIHFKKCNNIRFPDKLREIKITNPDAPSNDHYVEVQYRDQVLKLVPIIFSSVQTYDLQKGGEFFGYLVFKLLVVEKVGNNWRFKPGTDDEPILLDVQEVPDYFNKIGMNTHYIIHPEEILAENFVLMVIRGQNVRTKWVLEKMENVFQSQLTKQASI